MWAWLIIRFSFFFAWFTMFIGRLDRQLIRKINRLSFSFRKQNSVESQQIRMRAIDVAYQTDVNKITEFDKAKIRGKERNSSQSAQSKESSNDLSVLDCVRLNNAARLIIGHLNINSLKNKFEML